MASRRRPACSTRCRVSRWYTSGSYKHVAVIIARQVGHDLRREPAERLPVFRRVQRQPAQAPWRSSRASPASDPRWESPSGRRPGLPAGRCRPVVWRTGRRRPAGAARRAGRRTRPTHRPHSEPTAAGRAGPAVFWNPASSRSRPSAESRPARPRGRAARPTAPAPTGSARRPPRRFLPSAPSARRRALPAMPVRPRGAGCDRQFIAGSVHLDFVKRRGVDGPHRVEAGDPHIPCLAGREADRPHDRRCRLCARVTTSNFSPSKLTANSQSVMQNSGPY